MTEPNLFDNTELTVLGELERVVNDRIKLTELRDVRYELILILGEINRLKPTEIEKLKLAFAEGGSIPQSAESWVRKFRQNCG